MYMYIYSYINIYIYIYYSCIFKGDTIACAWACMCVHVFMYVRVCVHIQCLTESVSNV